jgi:hypothetical protein
MFDKIKKKGTMVIAFMFVFLVKMYTEFEYSFKKYVLPYLPKHIEQTIFDFSENGNIICKSYSIDEMNENRKKIKSIDFALHKEYDKTSEKYNAFVVDNLRNYPNSVFKKCKKHFMSVELSAYDKTYEIHLDNNNNYYLENNEVLFYEFLQYILYNDHGTYLNLDEKYTITIVDNDCNIVTLDRTQYIKFSSNKYEIITRKKYIQETGKLQIPREIKKDKLNNNEIENAIKMEEDIKTENVSELKTIHEIELEEAEEYLEWEKKELEHHIESYYADENKNDELFKCDNCENIYANSTSKKIILLRDSYHENEETCLCEECYHLNDNTYNNRKWIKQT